eukprot:TRINITY_DN476_c0_g1_i1.p1 TRINITY_DN476_c0_g1~~TRINITY_DN476_c0_g1_i1.p1  ORF type:complete len:331 (+),score=73.38 TRINITY_DN476_c0_g1_i1:61-993(+)
MCIRDRWYQRRVHGDINIEDHRDFQNCFILLMSFAKVKDAILKPVVSCIRINGMINQNRTALLVKSLEKVNTLQSKALAVIIDSEGGRPGQGQIMAEKLKYFAEAHHLKLYTFAQSMAASAAYVILCVGDHVVADRTSLVPSIGALSVHFSVKNQLNKLGIEPRLIPSNDKTWEHVGSALKHLSPEEREKILEMTKKTHEIFIDHVKKYREGKLKATPKELEESIFQGDVVQGNEALRLGIVDEVGTHYEILKRDFPNAQIVEVSPYTAFEQKIQDMRQMRSSLHTLLFPSNSGSPLKTVSTYLKDMYKL